MFSPLTKGCAVNVIAIVLCLIVNPASAAPKKTLGDGKITEAEYQDTEVHVASAKAKSRPVRIVPKLYVVHPQVSTSKKSGK
jgi:hypothetical protein